MANLSEKEDGHDDLDHDPRLEIDDDIDNDPLWLEVEREMALEALGDHHKGKRSEDDLSLD